MISSDLSFQRTENFPDIEGELQRIFVARKDLHKAPGSSFLMDTGHSQRLTTGFGHINNSGDEPTADTAFRIASCTKSFTAALILILRDEGLLDLDRPAREYLPSLARWTLPREDSASPTIRMFLTMSSGLATDNEWADRQEAMGRAEFDQLLACGVRFVSEPGTAFEYSNLGYAILGRIAEVVTGESYTHLVSERLFKPLGLHATDFAPNVAMNRCATGYVLHGQVWESLPQPRPGAFSAIGGIYSTLEDLAAWGHWLRRGFDGGTDSTDAVLSKASRRQMQQIHRFIPERVPATGYGFGLFVSHDPTFGQVIYHSGGYPGFSSHMRWLSAAPVLAIGLENATYAGVHEVVTEAFNAIASTSPRGQEPSSHEPWEETLAAQQVVQQLLTRWDRQLLAKYFALNVGQDQSWDRRQAEIDALLNVTGTLDFTQSQVVEQGPARLSWLIPGEHRTLCCEILMHPLARPLIQRFSVKLDPIRHGE